MRTTIYINTLLLDKLEKAMDKLVLPKNEVISLLLSQIINKNNFRPKTYESVKYQESDPDIVWKIKHIRFDPEFSVTSSTNLVSSAYIRCRTLPCS